jgi:tetratricopeptide (TPR) repeat protein
MLHPNQQYRIDQYHRNDVMDATRRLRLIQEAKSANRQFHLSRSAVLLTLLARTFREINAKAVWGFEINALVKRAVVLMALAALFGFAASTQAQSMRDSGGGEPYDPALVSFRVGIYCHNQGDYESALAEFTATIDGLPSWGVGYAARGDTYAALGEYALAITDYTTAIGIYPDYVSALYTRGRAYHALGEFELAEEDYVNAIAQMPDYAPTYWGLGDLLFEQGDRGAALTQYQRYLALTSDAPDTEVVARVTMLETLAEADTL